MEVDKVGKWVVGFGRHWVYFPASACCMQHFHHMTMLSNTMVTGVQLCIAAKAVDHSIPLVQSSST